MKPLAGDYYPYFGTYIDLVRENDPVSALRSSSEESLSLMKSSAEEFWNYAYAPGKWTVKEVMVHLCDTERIFAYRALSFARGETQMLPAFDENLYATNSNAGNLTPAQIVLEYTSVRQSSITLFGNFSDDVLNRKGKVPAGAVTVNAIAFAICGHNLHHLKVIRDRYLK